MKGERNKIMQSPVYNQPRRANRTVNDEAWLKVMLHKSPYGSLGTEQQGQPYVKPTLFAFDEAKNAIYFHGATEGHTPLSIEANPRTCFCVCELGRLLPADSAMEFGIEYASLVAFGKTSFVHDPEEARYGLQLLLDKYFPHLKSGEDYRPIVPEELNITLVYRLDIESWSGKQEHAAENFPGAFLYEDKIKTSP
jgi:nitroimidazol reductase NimA-like FMN-containing flavoprotein (pyridoxamine 5'-phosphate oxidase superfamily)